MLEWGAVTLARTLPLAYAAFVVLGLPEGFGVAWPTMRTDLGRSLAELGVLLVAWSIGYLVAAALNGPVTDRWRAGVVLAASSAATAAGLAAVALTPNWVTLLAASVLVGLGGGLVDAGVNAHVALLHSPRAMGMLHASFGIGATLAPLLMGLAVRSPGSWRAAFGLFAALQLAIGAAFWARRDRWDRRPVTPRPGRPRARSGRILATSLAVFFVYTGIEVAAGQWAFSLFTEERAMGGAAASAWVAAYWASFTLGRLLLGVVGDRVSPRTVVRVGVAALLGGSLVLWVPDPSWLGAVGLVVMGAGLAPIFPSLMVLTPERMGTDFASWAVGYQLAAAAVGAAAIPGLVGVTVAAAGLETLGPVLLASGAALALLETALRGADASPPVVRAGR